MRLSNPTGSTSPSAPLETSSSGGIGLGTVVTSDSPFIISDATVRVLRVRSDKISAEIVADLIIEFCYQHGDAITNMRLQRLLYFAQAWHLAIQDTPLFPETFEAWPSGPVQPGVYERFSIVGHRPIESRRPRWQVPKKIEQHLYDLMAAYGTLSAFELELQSQRDLPWVEAWGSRPLESTDRPTVSNKTMKSFYRKRLSEDGQKQGKAKG